jgi:G3E family GTPase
VHHAHVEDGHDHHSDSGGEATHIGSIRSWVVEEARPVDWDRLSPRLGDIVGRYGRSMLRMKGVVWTADDARPLVIHGVQQLFHTPVRLKKWPRQPRTSIVVIGERTASTAVGLIADVLAGTAVSGASSSLAAVAESPAGQA